MMKICKTVLAAVALVWPLAAATGLCAQTLEKGAVHGTVFDTTHSYIPNAQLTLTNP
jgi:hypothetical protein